MPYIRDIAQAVKSKLKEEALPLVPMVSWGCLDCPWHLGAAGEGCIPWYLGTRLPQFRLRRGA